LKLKIANNPKQTFFAIQLAEHYWGQKSYKEAESLLQGMVANPKQYPGAALDAGDFYRRVGKLDEAAGLYRKGLDSDPERKSEYRQRLVGILLQQGKVQDAIVLLDAILKEQPTDADAIISRASLRIATGESGEMHTGVAELTRLLQRTPGNNQVRYDLAGAYLQMGRPDEAKALLQEILGRDPKHAKALLEMADLSIRNRQPDEALQYAERLLAIDPDNIEARLVRTSAWALRGRFSEVRSELRRLMADNPDLLEPQLQMATLDLEEKRYDEAERIYRRVYQSEKDGFRGLRGLVNLYFVKGEPAKALELVRQDKRPDHVEVRALLAQAASQAGKMDLAQATLQKLVRDFPENTDYLLSLGELYQNQGQFPLAIATFQKAQQAAPKNGLCPAHLADAFSSAGRFPEAVAAYRQSLALEPENPLMMNNLAWNLALSETNLDEALQLAQRALQKAPESSQYADTLGFVYLKLKQFDRALQTFRGIVRKDPAISIYKIHLAMGLIASKQPQEARTELEAALRDRNTPSEAGQIRGLMLQLK
jgi:FimV-like protein